MAGVKLVQVHDDHLRGVLEEGGDVRQPLAQRVGPVLGVDQPELVSLVILIFFL